MYLRVTTESGSSYYLDAEHMMWRRTNATKNLRTSGGSMTRFPDLLVGHSMVIYGPALDPQFARENPGAFRQITSTPVTGIEVFQDGMTPRSLMSFRLAENKQPNADFCANEDDLLPYP